MRPKGCVKNLFYILAVCFVFLPSAVRAQVTGMRVSSGPARVRIVLDLDAPASFTEAKGQPGIRLEVGTGVTKALERSLKDPVVQKIRLAKKGKNAGVLEVDLGKSAQHKVLVLKKPDRLVLDVYRIQIVKTTRELGDGLSYTYWQDDMKGLPVRLYVLSLKPGSSYYLKPFSGAGDRNGRGRLTAASAVAGARAAVNASYFDTDGWVIGNCKWQGAFYGMDTTPRSALVIDKTGNPSVQQDLSYRGSVSLPDGQVMEIKGINRQRMAQDLVLFNRYYGPETRTNEYGREVKVKQGRAAELSNKGNMRLDSDSLVLSGHGSSADILARIKRGDRVAIDQTLGSRLADDAILVLGGGPSLVEKGQVNVRSREESIAADIAYGRAPRTGVGVKEDGTVLLMVVDGRSAYSAGMTLKEFGEYFKRFGAKEAVNFDGGGSSEMVLDRKIMNRPSDGGERPISIGLGVFKK